MMNQKLGRRSPSRPSFSSTSSSSSPARILLLALLVATASTTVLTNVPYVYGNETNNVRGRKKKTHNKGTKPTNPAAQATSSSSSSSSFLSRTYAGYEVPNTVFVDTDKIQSNHSTNKAPPSRITSIDTIDSDNRKIDDSTKSEDDTSEKVLPNASDYDQSRRLGIGHHTRGSHKVVPKDVSSVYHPKGTSLELKKGKKDDDDDEGSNPEDYHSDKDDASPSSKGKTFKNMKKSGKKIKVAEKGTKAKGLTSSGKSSSGKSSKTDHSGKTSKKKKPKQTSRSKKDTNKLTKSTSPKSQSKSSTAKGAENFPEDYD